MIDIKELSVYDLKILLSKANSDTQNIKIKYSGNSGLAIDFTKISIDLYTDKYSGNSTLEITVS